MLLLCRCGVFEGAILFVSEPYNGAMAARQSLRTALFPSQQQKANMGELTMRLSHFIEAGLWESPVAFSFKSSLIAIVTLRFGENLTQTLI